MCPAITNNPGRRWLSPKSAAIYLDLKDVATIYAWAADGTLPGVARVTHRDSKGVGKHKVTIRIDRLAVDRWLERQAQMKVGS